MAIDWISEACDHRYDPQSGALITYLTCSPFDSINIYCEQPYTSPDGNRVAILRRLDAGFDGDWALLIADLTTLRLAPIEPGGLEGFGNAAWSGKFLYTLRNGGQFRVDLETLERETIKLPTKTSLKDMLLTVTPDQRQVVFPRASSDATVTELVSLDLGAQRERVIAELPGDGYNHHQCNPIDGRDILIQNNRGVDSDPPGGAGSTTHFVIGIDGSNLRPLPCGPPYTESSTGHSNFVANTGRVAWTGHFSATEKTLDPRYPDGNLFTAAPGDRVPTMFAAPEHRFIHVNVSRCGRYFVCDSAPPGSYGEDGVLCNMSLVIGNLTTGKYRTLVSDIGGPSGGGQHTHAHAYLAADNRTVIYNAPTLGGATQVCAARVPEGVLEGMD